MKLTKLLFMSTLLLAGNSVSATVVDGVRQKPVPQKSALQFGTAMYMYNVDAKQFFKGANDWNTRGSVGEAGYKVWITKHLDETGTWDNQSIILKDSVETKKAILMTWAAANGDVWVDWNLQADTLWALHPQGDEIYYLSVGAGNAVYNSATYPDMYLGLKTAEATTNTRLFWNLPVADGLVKWYFVSVADAATYAGVLDLYTTAQSLKALLDEAKGKGLDVSAQETVYLNEGSTKEELTVAIAAVKEALAKAEENTASVSAPLDKTSLIVNPSYDSNANTGWSGTAPAFQSYTDAEFYDKTFDYYQDIKGAPRGVYAVSLSAFYRAGTTAASYQNFKDNTNNNAKLYAKAGKDSLNANLLNNFVDAQTNPLASGETSLAVDGTTYYVPNNMASAAEYFKAGLYGNNKLIFATEDGDMRIGLKKTVELGSDWTLFDNWKLTYYGNGADAYTMWLDEVKKTAKDYSSLPAGTIVTEGMIDAYNNKIAGLTSASTKQDVVDAVNLIETESLAVDSNIIAWKDYQAAITKGKTVANDPKIVGSDKDLLADYCDLESEDILNAATLTTEEVKAETQKVLLMIDNALKNGITEGTDVSDKYLVNANFEATNGWIKKAASGGNVAYGGISTNKCYEAWNNSDFDIYQEVKGAPIGVYQLSVQGFYRYGRGANAWTAYTNGTANNDVVSIYVNNNSTHFKSVFDEHVAYSGNGVGELYQNSGDLVPYINPDSTYWYPNDMGNSAIAFQNGLYKVSSYGVVARTGDVLRVGVKGATNQLGDSWAIWDNFQMIFQGTNATVVKPLLQQAIDELNANLSSAGKIGATVTTNAQNAINEANNALAQTDGKVMFDALVNILNNNDSIKASATLFKSLELKKEELTAALISSTALQSTKDEGALLLENIENGLAGNTMENAQATGFIAQVSTMISKLAIPAEAASASDANPVDMTSVLKTPSFEKDGANSIEGWNATGYNFGNDDTQKGALLVEFYNKTFDLNQTIENLPNGTYKVTANAFYRFGSADQDYEHFIANELAGNAYIYAVSEADTMRTPLKLLASGATVDLGYTGTTNITNTDKYVPNTMVAASAYFLDGGYQNEVIVKVTNGKLTLGIRQDKTVATDWVIMDNFTLTYYGPNSTLTETGDYTGIEDVQTAEAAVAKVEYFGINGEKKSSLTKGINIVKVTLADGSAKVRKVIVK